MRRFLSLSIVMLLFASCQYFEAHEEVMTLPDEVWFASAAYRFDVEPPAWVDLPPDWEIELYPPLRWNVVAEYGPSGGNHQLMCNEASAYDGDIYSIGDGIGSWLPCMYGPGIYLEDHLYRPNVVQSQTWLPYPVWSDEHEIYTVFGRMEETFEAPGGNILETEIFLAVACGDPANNFFCEGVLCDGNDWCNEGGFEMRGAMHVARPGIGALTFFDWPILVAWIGTNVIAAGPRLKAALIHPGWEFVQEIEMPESECSGISCQWFPAMTYVPPTKDGDPNKWIITWIEGSDEGAEAYAKIKGVEIGEAADVGEVFIVREFPSLENVFHMHYDNYYETIEPKIAYNPEDQNYAVIYQEYFPEEPVPQKDVITYLNGAYEHIGDCYLPYAGLPEREFYDFEYLGKNSGGVSDDYRYGILAVFEGVASASSFGIKKDKVTREKELLVEEEEDPQIMIIPITRSYSPTCWPAWVDYIDVTDRDEPPVTEVGAYDIALARESYYEDISYTGVTYAIEPHVGPEYPLYLTEIGRP